MGSTRIREIDGRPEKFVFWVAVAWALFQLWLASPLPYYFKWGIFNSTEARSVSLAFAVFLGLSCYPIVQGRRERPIQHWEIFLALLGAGTAAYMFLFFEDLSNRAGAYSPLDLATGTIGLILLIDAARRAIALPVAIAAVGCIGYAVFGSGIGEKIWEVSFERLVTHYWLTTEGVFGISLGIAVSMVFLGVVLGSGLDRLNFGDRFIGWIFRLYSANRNSDGITSIPRWLRGRTWTWVFAFQILGLNSWFGRTEYLPIFKQFVATLILFLLLVGGKSLVNFARVRMGTNRSASIWNFCDVAIIVGLLMAVGASSSFIDTVTIILIALPIIVFRRMREKPDGETSKAKPRKIKTEIETSAYGIVLVGLLSTSLTTAMFSIGYLVGFGYFITAQATLPTALVAGVIVLVAIALLTWSERKNTDRNFLPLALFLVIVAVLGNGLFVSRYSPGLSAFQAVISGLVLVAMTPIANWIAHRNQPLRMVAQTALMDVVDWMSLAGRNAVPVVLLAATIGIGIGTITFTATGAWNLESLR